MLRTPTAKIEITHGLVHLLSDSYLSIRDASVALADRSKEPAVSDALGEENGQVCLPALQAQVRSDLAQEGSSFVGNGYREVGSALVRILHPLDVEAEKIRKAGNDPAD